MLTTSYPLWKGHHAGQFIQRYAEALVQQGHEVIVVAPGSNRVPSCVVEDQIMIVRFPYFIPRASQVLAYGNGILPNLKKSVLARMQLPFFMCSFYFWALKYSKQCDLVHAHWSVSAFPGLWVKRMRSIPIVLSLRGSDFSGAGGKLMDRITSYVLKRVDGLVTRNQLLLEKAQQNGGCTRHAMVIRSGVDLAQFKGALERDIWKGTIAEGVKNILLFVGRLTEVKGPDLALHTFEKVLELHPESCLVVVGDGPMRMELEHVVQSHEHLSGHVYFMGELMHTEMPKIYNAVDLLMISSRAEGMPNAMLESLSSGVAVASFPVGGVPEVITHKQNGFLSSAPTVDALSHAIHEALSDPRLMHQVRKAARAWTVDYLGWDKAVKDHIALYERILDLKADG